MYNPEEEEKPQERNPIITTQYPGVTFVSDLEKYTDEENTKLAKEKLARLEKLFPNGIPRGEYHVDQEIAGDTEEKGNLKILRDEFFRGVDNLWSDWQTAGLGFEDIIGTATDEDVRQRRREIEQQIRDQAIQYGDSVSFQDLLDSFNDDDPDTLPGHLLDEYLTTLAGQSASYMAPGLALGSAGAYAGSIFGPVGTIAGGTAGFVIGMTIGQLPAFFGTMIERQIMEGAETAEDLKSGLALAAGTAASATDSLLFLLLRGGGKPVQDAAIDSMTAAILQTAKSGLKAGTVEAGTEIVQTDIERKQAGLDPIETVILDYLAKLKSGEDLSPEEQQALSEYIEAGAGGFFLGGPLGLATKGGSAGIEYATGERFAGPDATFESEVEAARENKKKQNELLNLDLNIQPDFSIDIPSSPNPTDEAEILEPLSNIIRYEPKKGKGMVPAIPFSEVPTDARVRLHWATPVQEEDINGDPIIVHKPLIDPETKRPVFGTYQMSEFVPEGSSVPDLSPAVKEDMKITIDNIDYFPQWEPDTKSFAEVPIGKRPQSRVYSTPVDSDLTSWLNFLGYRYLNSNFKPEKSLPRAEWEQIVKRKSTGERAENRRARDIKLTMDKAIKTLSKTKSDVFDLLGLETMVDKQISFKKAQDDFLTGQTTRKELFDYFEYNKQSPEVKRKIKRMVDSFTAARTLVDMNTKKIDEFMHKVDPDMEAWPVELRETINKNLGSYLTRAYKLTLPGVKFNAPNRDGASAQEQSAHLGAVKYLAERFNKQGVPNPVQAAEALLDSIYKKEVGLDKLSEGGLLPDSSTFGNSPTDSIDVRMDESVLKPRGDINEAVRKAIGEITDPSDKFVVTAFKQTEFLSGYSALYDLFEMASNPETRWISRVKEGRFNQEIQGDKTNPFAGFYTTDSFAQGIQEAFNSGLMPQSLSNQVGHNGLQSFVDNFYAPIFLYPKTVVAEGKIVYSPKTQIRNFVSAAGTLLVNGNISSINPTALQAAFKNAAAYLNNATPAEARRMVELGLLDSSVTLGNLARTYELAGSQSSMNGVFQGLDIEAEKAGVANTAMEKTRQLYLFSDNFFKVLNYIGEKRKYKKAFPLKIVSDAGGRNIIPEDAQAQYEQNMQTMEDLMYGYKPKFKSDNPIRRHAQMIEELAAYRTRNTVPNYEYVGRFVEILRASPVSNFTAFPTEIFRTQYNIAAMAGKDMEIGMKTGNPRLVANGVARAFSHMAYLATMGLILPLTAALRIGLPIGIAYALGEFVADYAEDNNRLVLKFDKETNTLEYVDGTHTDMYDQIGSAVRAYYRDAFRIASPASQLPTGSLVGVTADFIKNMSRALYSFGESYIEDQILLKAFLKARSNYDSEREKKVTEIDPNVNPVGYWTAIGKEFFLDILPGVITQGVDVIEASGEGLETLSDYNQPQDAAEELFALSGFDVKKINFNDAYHKFKVKEFINRRTEINRQVFREQAGGGDRLFDGAAILESYYKANEELLGEVDRHRNLLNTMYKVTGRKPEYWQGLLFKENEKRYNSLGSDDRANLYRTKEGATFVPIDPDQYFREFLREAETVLKREGVTDVRVQQLKDREKDLRKQLLDIRKEFKNRTVLPFDFSVGPAWAKEYEETGEDVRYKKPR